MTPPAPVWPVVVRAIWAAVINDRRRIVVYRAFDDFRPFDRIRPLPISRAWRNRRCALLRHAAAQIERSLDRETSFVLPGDLAPAAIARCGIDQAAAGNLGNDLASGTGRRMQVDG